MDPPRRTRNIHFAYVHLDFARIIFTLAIKSCEKERERKRELLKSHSHMENEMRNNRGGIRLICGIFARTRMFAEKIFFSAYQFARSYESAITITSVFQP